MTETNDSDITEDEKSYIEKLNHEVSSGGCAEMWEATQKHRKTDRRKFLAGLVGSLFFGTSAAETVSAKERDLPREPETEVQLLNDHETKNVLRIAIQNENFKKLIDEVWSKGLNPRFSSVKAYHSKYNGDEWNYLRVPFDGHSSKSKKQKGGVMWSSRGKGRVYGYISEEEIKPGADLSPDVVKAVNKYDIEYSSLNTTPVKTKHTRLSIDNGELSSETNSRIVPITTDKKEIKKINREVSIETHKQKRISIKKQKKSGCLCTAISSAYGSPCFPCGYPNWGCIYDLADAYAEEIATCGGCVETGNQLVCIGCIAIIVTNGNWTFCCYCNRWDEIL